MESFKSLSNPTWPPTPLHIFSAPPNMQRPLICKRNLLIPGSLDIRQLQVVQMHLKCRKNVWQVMKTGVSKFTEEITDLLATVKFIMHQL